MEMESALKEKMENSINIINDYSKENHNNKVHCRIDPQKGRCLYSENISLSYISLNSNRKFKRGDTIFIEPSLFSVCEVPQNELFIQLKALCEDENFEYEAIWYWCALNSFLVREECGKEERYTSLPVQTITKKKQNQLLSLFSPNVTKPSNAIIMIIDKLLSPLPAVSSLSPLSSLFSLSSPDPLLLEKLLQIWIMNCFEYMEDPLGFVLYFFSSFISHSCEPNCVWILDAKDNFILRARGDIQEGEELTVSYLSEETLLSPISHRKNSLATTKNFICHCSRCVEPFDLVRSFQCPSCRKGFIYHDLSSSSPLSSLSPLSLDWAAITGQKLDDIVSDENHQILSQNHPSREPKREQCDQCAKKISPIEKRFFLDLERFYDGLFRKWTCNDEAIPDSNKSDLSVQEYNYDAITLSYTSWKKIHRDMELYFPQHWLYYLWLTICSERSRTIFSFLQKYSRERDGDFDCELEERYQNLTSDKAFRILCIKKKIALHKTFSTQKLFVGSLYWLYEELVDKLFDLLNCKFDISFYFYALPLLAKREGEDEVAEERRGEENRGEERDGEERNFDDVSLEELAPLYNDYCQLKNVTRSNGTSASSSTVNGASNGSVELEQVRRRLFKCAQTLQQNSEMLMHYIDLAVSNLILLFSEENDSVINLRKKKAALLWFQSFYAKNSS